ncbi:hypothetical protein A4X03_0g5597, partial [Tilletia caries]
MRNLLRLESDQLHQLERSSGVLESVPESFRIRHMDIYNEVRQQLLRAARKAPDRLSSLQKWVDEVQGNGGIAAINQDIPCAEDEQTWAAYFLSSWQVDMLLAHGQNSV